MKYFKEGNFRPQTLSRMMRYENFRGHKILQVVSFEEFHQDKLLQAANFKDTDIKKKKTNFYLTLSLHSFFYKNQ